MINSTAHSLMQHVLIAQTIAAYESPFDARDLVSKSREFTAFTSQLEPYGKSRKPKTPPKPIDPVWQKKRKKLLAELRRKKCHR